MKVQRRVIVLLVVLLATVGARPSHVRLPASAAPVAPSLAQDFCPPLPPPSGPVVHVSNVAELQAAVNSASVGTTILVADGSYALDGAYLRFATPGVILRSASGDREAVVLDGNHVSIVGCAVLTDGKAKRPRPVLPRARCAHSACAARLGAHS